jgi:hypothetical protein
MPHRNEKFKCVLDRTNPERLAIVQVRTKEGRLEVERPLLGAESIAKFVFGKATKKEKRKVYYMHENRLLRTFKMGAEIAALPSQIQQDIEERAAAADDTA